MITFILIRWYEIICLMQKRYVLSLFMLKEKLCTFYEK